MNDLLRFCPSVPSEIVINRNWSCRDSEPENAWKNPYLARATVENVSAALDKGPFAAIATLGTRCYTAEPILIPDLVPDHDIYGWNVGAQRANEIFKQSIIICGVQRRNGIEQIYYVLADDVSEKPQMAIGKFKLSADKRVFAASLKTYAESEFDMFPPTSEEEIERYKSQEVIPPPLVGHPKLIQLWKEGKIRYELKEDGKWHLSGERIIPPPIAADPDLINKWKKGDLRCEFDDGKWIISEKA